MKYEEATIESLVKKITTYGPESDLDSVKKAYLFALEKTKNINDDSSRAVLAHLLNTAQIAAEQMMDDETIIAALLHDLPAKTNCTHEEIEKIFGKEITGIVEGLSKTITIEEKNIDNLDSNTLPIAILAASKDIRSVFLRMMTRTERLRAIEKYPKEKQLKIANNTLKIYVPLCHKLGLDKLEWEMEDLCFKTLNPRDYRKIKEKICVKREVREKELENIKKEITELLQKNNFNITIQGRVKNFYSIYMKTESGKNFGETRIAIKLF